MRESKIILKSFFLKHNYIDYFWFALFPLLRETKIFIVLIIVSIITYSRLQLRIKNDYRGLINISIILNKTLVFMTYHFIINFIFLTLISISFLKLSEFLIFSSILLITHLYKFIQIND